MKKQIKDYRIICSICVRGGSKGVKNKNIRSIGGRPLLAHSIQQAKASNIFRSIVVSSDADEILETAQNWGADLTVKRPDHLASDTAAKLPAIRHCILEAEERLSEHFDIVVDLDATSPLRTPDDIKGSVELLLTEDTTNVITACKARRSPYFNLVELNKTGVVTLSKSLNKAITRRQDAPACFDMNASIYVWYREVLMEHTDSVFLDGTRLFEMPEARSIDIDTELDFQIVEFLMNRS